LQPADGWDGWSFQRWSRLDVLLHSLSQKIGGMKRALGSSVPYSKSYDELKSQSTVSAPPGHEAPLTESQLRALEHLTNALDEAADAFATAAPGYPIEPLPEPELRARSIL
jgi:hypothetical protein